MRRPLPPGTPDLAPPALFVITGVMAAGKSTVAQALAERLPNSVHLRGDVFRKLIVSGRAAMTAGLSDEAEAQLNLRYRLAAGAAREYLNAGFLVVYQDIIVGKRLPEVLGLLPASPFLVVLCPDAEVVAAETVVVLGVVAGVTEGGVDRDPFRSLAHGRGEVR